MSPWSNKEVELIVADYFDMLFMELANKSYKKSEHRRKLLPLLNNRSEGSIEFKHQNISAVLAYLGQPFIKGYLPRFNYQQVLESSVINYLVDHSHFEKIFKEFADKKLDKTKIKKDFNRLLVKPPKPTQQVDEPAPYYSRNPIKTNYLEKEQKNRTLGYLGEELVLEYEKWQLNNFGKSNLAEQVRWISKEEGDGAGFDILSKNPNGTDRFIEVKNTKLGKETPFYFSRNELLFSQSKSNNFYLYRLFNFEQEPRLFIKSGSLNSICSYFPMNFKGHF
ncbi:DUF3883 domain-containing protein [Salibacter sp.]|uniref:DUF3883 domain-containing protein n=1 Tax=Salibacter sp. TaxID=2010995 RepID=UPI00286FC4D6|nr:DUF3883 domain-containing protein [Salibacter sp.]MDR9398781.1 DUF3883 domain-containing protein [Salibacter sp.]MDR9487879.1 DUF3883 domain-containing protein [Salibacter sp.]